MLKILSWRKRCGTYRLIYELESLLLFKDYLLVKIKNKCKPERIELPNKQVWVAVLSQRWFVENFKNTRTALFLNARVVMSKILLLIALLNINNLIATHCLMKIRLRDRFRPQLSLTRCRACAYSAVFIKNTLYCFTWKILTLAR